MWHVCFHGAHAYPGRNARDIHRRGSRVPATALSALLAVSASITVFCCAHTLLLNTVLAMNMSAPTNISQGRSIQKHLPGVAEESLPQPHNLLGNYLPVLPDTCIFAGHMRSDQYDHSVCPHDTHAGQKLLRRSHNIHLWWHQSLRHGLGHRPGHRLGRHLGARCARSAARATAWWPPAAHPCGSRSTQGTCRLDSPDPWALSQTHPAAVNDT